MYHHWTLAGLWLVRQQRQRLRPEPQRCSRHRGPQEIRSAIDMPQRIPWETLNLPPRQGNLVRRSRLPRLSVPVFAEPGDETFGNSNDTAAVNRLIESSVEARRLLISEIVQAMPTGRSTSCDNENQWEHARPCSREAPSGSINRVGSIFSHLESTTWRWWPQIFTGWTQ